MERLKDLGGSTQVGLGRGSVAGGLIVGIRAVRMVKRKPLGHVSNETP